LLIKSSGASSSSLARLLRLARQLNDELQQLRFSPPVSHVYNPLDYAWPVYEGYLRKFASGAKRVVFLGMNPGPFGMAQTGVPFGEVASVRDWLNLQGKVGRPEREHPRRLVTGFNCPRSEVSGQRLWSLFARRFGAAENFFEQHLVLNYCPLAFMEDSGRNLTPDKLSGSEKQRLFDACDRHLEQTIAILKPEWLIGVGDFARKRAERIFSKGSPRIAQILHPSPANPSANRAWAQVVTGQLVSLGVWH
jgi:single-strand selective monofunctional uracil DNA glycosylase